MNQFSGETREEKDELEDPMGYPEDDNGDFFYLLAALFAASP